MKELIFIIEKDIEGGFTAKALGESIFTQGETMDELKKNIKDAIDCHFDNKEDIPKVIRMHIVEEEVFSYV